jgi:hypothetical protein
MEHPLYASRVRQLIPLRTTGTYRLALLRDGRLNKTYLGRSDTCLRRRLLWHASRGRFTHFAFEMTPGPRRAYRDECREWHRLRRQASNRIHPDAPDGSGLSCSYCLFARSPSVAALRGRLPL